MNKKQTENGMKIDPGVSGGGLTDENGGCNDSMQA